jgi:hypothetical protein
MDPDVLCEISEQTINHWNEPIKKQIMLKLQQI